MRISLTLDVTGADEPREGNKSRALDVYRLATLAVVFLLSVIECGIAFSRSWMAQYAFGVSFTAVIVTAVVATAQIVGPVTGPVWLELVLALTFGILWMVVGIVSRQAALSVIGWITFGLIMLYSVLLALAAACQALNQAYPWGCPVHALGDGQIRLKGELTAGDPQASAESAQTFSSAQTQLQGAHALRGERCE